MHKIKRVIPVVLMLAILLGNVAYTPVLYVIYATSSQVVTYFDAVEGQCVGYSIDTIGDPYGSLPVPTKTGYIFMGWFNDYYNEVYEITGASIVPNASRTIVAHWAQPINLVNLGAGKCLNIYGSDFTSLSNGLNVTVWSSSGSPEQKWLIYNIESNTIDQFIRSYVDKNFGLHADNEDTPWDCDIHQIIGYETTTSIFMDWTYYGYYTFRLNLFDNGYHDALTSAGYDDGSNVYWTMFNGSNYQKWDKVDL